MWTSCTRAPFPLGTMISRSARPRQRPPVLPSRAMERRPRPAGGFEGARQVGRVAAGGEDDQDVAGFAQGLDLPGKDEFKPEIVADAGQGGRVGDEAHGGPGPAVAVVAAHQFFGQVEGVGRAAAIAAGQDLVSLLKTLAKHPAGLAHRGQQRAEGPQGGHQFIEVFFHCSMKFPGQGSGSSKRNRMISFWKSIHPSSWRHQSVGR